MKKKVTIVYVPTDGGESKTVVIELILGDGENQSGLSIPDQLIDFILSIDFEDEESDLMIVYGNTGIVLDKVQEKAEQFKLIIPEYKNHYNLNWMVIIVYYMDIVLKMTAWEIAEALNFESDQPVLTILGKKKELLDGNNIHENNKDFLKHYGYINEEIAAPFILILRRLDKKKNQSFFFNKKRGKADE